MPKALPHAKQGHFTHSKPCQGLIRQRYIKTTVNLLLKRAQQ